MNIAQYLSNGLNLSYNQIEAISKLADACGMTTLFEGKLGGRIKMAGQNPNTSSQLVTSLNNMNAARQAEIDKRKAEDEARLAEQKRREAAEQEETRRKMNMPLGKIISPELSAQLLSGSHNNEMDDSSSDIFSIMDLHEKTGRSAGVDMNFGNQSDSDFSGDTENLDDVEHDAIASVKNAAKFDQDVFDKEETNDVNTQEQDALHNIISKMGEFSTKTKDAVKTIADNVVSTLADFSDNRVDVDDVGEQDSLFYKSSSEDDPTDEQRKQSLRKLNTSNDQTATSSDARQDLEDFVADVNRTISTMDVDDPATQSHLGDLYGEIYTFTTRYTDNQFNDILQTIAGYVPYKNKLEGKVDEMDTDADNYITSNAMKKRSYKSHAVQQKLDLNKELAKINRLRKMSGKAPQTMEQFLAARSGVTPEEFNADKSSDMEFWKALNADKVR